jgi:hypothetical protein
VTSNPVVETANEECGETPLGTRVSGWGYSG